VLVPDIDIRPSRFLSPVAQRLVAAALADLGSRYGNERGDDTPVEAMEFDPPDGAFFIAWRDGEPIGCVGWRSHEVGDEIGELKRLYVDPSARGTGVASALMATVEESARDHGRHRLILECGAKQPEAIALYEKLGYERIPDFGHYRGQPLVRSYGRDLK
jgi:GNAT superfamily N-acetyltransferase